MVTSNDDNESSPDSGTRNSNNTSHIGISALREEEKPDEKKDNLRLDDTFQASKRRNAPTFYNSRDDISGKRTTTASQYGTNSDTKKKGGLELDTLFQTPERREALLSYKNKNRVAGQKKFAKSEKSTEKKTDYSSPKNIKTLRLEIDENFINPPAATRQRQRQQQEQEDKSNTEKLLPAAKPFTPENLQAAIPVTEEEENQKKKMKKKIIIMILLFFVLATVVAAPLAFTFAPKKTNRPLTEFSTMEPSLSPSFVPSFIPSSSPSYSQAFADMVHFLSNSTNLTSRSELENPGSPQNHAAYWLVYKDETNISESNVKLLLERYSLVVLYYALAGEYWSLTPPQPSLDGIYLNPNTHVCEWTHPDSTYDIIGCNSNQRVTQIFLPGRNLTGQLPSEIGLLTEVTWLLFHQNQLSGVVPDAIGDNMKKLELAAFQDNALTGSIPEWIGTFPELIGASFGHNFMTGSLPPAWRNISNSPLLYLQLDNNMLTGSIESLSNFQLLNDIFIQDNFFDDGLDSGFFLKSTFLREADFSKNKFSGKIPASITASFLDSLDLSGNLFTGTLPLSFQAHTNLLYLNVRDNHLSGTIGPFISNWGDLIMLDISSNKFTGNIPLTLSSMTNLEFLSMSNNSFIPGEIPNMEACTNLKDFSLQQTSRTGLIPSWVGKMEKLVHLDLSFNNLSGSIPESLWTLPVLDFVFMRNNQLSGTIAKNITFDYGVVLLEQNNLTGKVDLCRVEILVADCEEVECNCCSECCQDGDVCNDREWIIEFDPNFWWDEFIPGMDYSFGHDNTTYQVTTDSPTTSLAPSTSMMPSVSPSSSAPTRNLPDRIWNGLKWGASEDAKFGHSVSLSHDGTILAVGAPYSSFNGTYSGFVQVYQKVSNTEANSWVQKGSALLAINSVEADSATNSLFGHYVCLSDDGSVLAIGAPLAGQQVGFAVVFRFNDALNDWEQVGKPIFGTIQFEEFADTIVLSGDASTLAVGAKYSSSSGQLSGQVRVFRLQNEEWVQHGSILNGAPKSLFGAALDLNYCGNILAISSPYALEFRGQVALYRFEGEDWILTRTFNGQYDSGAFGLSLTLNADGTILAVSSPFSFFVSSDATSVELGAVFVYKYQNDQSEWEPMGSTLSDEKLFLSLTHYTRFGTSVALSASGMELFISMKDESIIDQNEFLGGTSYYEFDGLEWVKNVWTDNGGYYDDLYNNPDGIPIALSGDGNTFAFGDNNNIFIFNDKIN